MPREVRITPAGLEWKMVLQDTIDDGLLFEGGLDAKQLRNQLKILDRLLRSPITNVEFTVPWLTAGLSIPEVKETFAYLLTNKYVEPVSPDDVLGDIGRQRAAKEFELDQSELWNSPLYCHLCKTTHGPYHDHLAGKQDEVQEYVRQVKRRSRETERLYNLAGEEVSNSEANINDPNIYTHYNHPDWRVRRKIGDRDAGIEDYD
jgi:hypothetical protein